MFTCYMSWFLFGYLLLLSVNDHHFNQLLSVDAIEDHLFAESSAKRSSANSPKDGPWPYPQIFRSTSQLFAVAYNRNHFLLSDLDRFKSCEIIENAFDRYMNLIFKESILRSRKTQPSYTSIKHLKILIDNDCENWPYLEMNEEYRLTLSEVASLHSKTVWGMLRGLETYSQLIYKLNDYLVVNETYILDYPRFQHRGLMVDTSRHYIPLEYLLKNLDAMSYNKLNTFHWHIVDDDSFPFVSRTYPQLSQLGAYNPVTHVYREEDVDRLLNYARLRGIRVVMEFDTPGHTLAWSKSMPGLVRKCTPLMNDGKPPKPTGIMNSSKNSTKSFLRKFFTEVSQTFPEKYLHLGGDEVPNYCEEDIQSNLTSANESVMRQHLQFMFNLVKKLKKNYIVWQEVVDSGIEIDSDAIVQVWKSWEQPNAVIANLARNGHKIISSNAWYLDLISYEKDWIKYYEYDPTSGLDDQRHQKNIIGGEACVWAEYVDESNLLSRTWPRASAVAERLWSSQRVFYASEASVRFNKHRCLLISRNIPAHPIDGPGFCPRPIEIPIQMTSQNLAPMFQQNIFLLTPEFFLMNLFIFIVLLLIVFCYKKRKRFQYILVNNSSSKTLS